MKHYIEKFSEILFSNVEKSYKLRSNKWEGYTSCKAVILIEFLSGNSVSQSAIICLTFLRCKFSCEPHKLQGIIGNCMALAYNSISLSLQNAKGLKTIKSPESFLNFGGMASILPPKKKFKKKVSKMSFL